MLRMLDVPIKASGIENGKPRTLIYPVAMSITYQILFFGGGGGRGRGREIAIYLKDLQSGYIGDTT